jgi:hypothetical protein
MHCCGQDHISLLTVNTKNKNKNTWTYKKIFDLFLHVLIFLTMFFAQLDLNDSLIVWNETLIEN